MSGIAGKVARRLEAEWREWRRWNALSSADDIRVYYGVDAMPRRDHLVTGGFVKCLDLAERFPNTAGNPNLLYLVSSALPARRDLLVRAAQHATGKFILNQNGVAYPAWDPNWDTTNAPNRIVHQRADFVIYQSEFCRRCAMRFLGNRRGDGMVLHNPVDTTVFVPRSGINEENRSPVILVAGSIHGPYRIRSAMEALLLIRKRVPGVRLLIAGRLAWSETAELQLNQWRHDLGLEEAVEFVGSYSQDKAPNLFRKADVLLHLKVQDPCPRIVVEAMACGLPVVYVATGGTPELVGESAGAGIPGEESFEHLTPSKPEAVTAAVCRVLKSRPAYACQARKRAVALFDVDKWLDAHAQIFRDAANA